MHGGLSVAVVHFAGTYQRVYRDLTLAWLNVLVAQADILQKCCVNEERGLS